MLTKDEVGGSLDVGLGVDLVSGLGEDCVLISEELACVVSLRITIGTECECLGTAAWIWLSDLYFK